MYKIKGESLQSILTYLGKRPFEEVFSLIQLIQSAEPCAEACAPQEGANDGNIDNEEA